MDYVRVNGMNRDFPRSVGAWGAICFGLVVIFMGCSTGEATSAGGHQKEQATHQQDNLSAQEILQRCQQQYAAASRYGDQANLVLSYRLSGNLMEEPHPWSVALDKSERRLRASLYHARVCADGERLSCFVYDFASKNLDEQYWTQPAFQGIPWQTLTSDPIAHHFLSGKTELPLHDHRAHSMKPPTLGLLGLEKLPAWWKPENAERLTDQAHPDGYHYVVSLVADQQEYRMWIDPESWLIWQIQYPNEILAEELIRSKEVTDLQVVARFENATIQPEFAAETFQLRQNEKMKRVTRFVAVPEPFPSNFIGQVVPAFQFNSLAGTSFDWGQRQGKVTVLAWVDDSQGSENVVRELQAVESELGTQDYFVAAAYSDRPSSSGSSGSQRVTNGWSAHGVSLLDPGYSNANSIQIKMTPAIAILDRENRLQYLKYLDEQPWRESLLELARRVRSGDELADEMKSEYQQFLESYRIRLRDARIDSPRADAIPVRMAGSQSGIRIQPIWTNEELNLPGNLVQGQSSSRDVWLMDGWQTVVQLGSDGQIIKRQRLPIPERSAIAKIDCVEFDQSAYRVAYTSLGQTAWVFDSSWNLVMQYPPSEHRHSGIQKAILMRDRIDGRAKLLVGFWNELGIHLVDIQSGALEREIVTGKLKTFAAPFLGTNQIACSSGTRGIRLFQDRGIETGRFDSVLTRVVDIYSAGNVALVSGTDADGNWIASRIDREFREKWHVVIGEQDFERPVSSLDYWPNRQGRAGIWAIADSDGNVQLISELSARGDIRRLQNIRLGSPVTGLGFMPNDKGALLVVATQESVHAWSLENVGARFSTRPAKFDQP